jgi:hypothetical protein
MEDIRIHEEAKLMASFELGASNVINNSEQKSE